MPTRSTTAPSSFGVRLRAAMDLHGPLCAGLDPHRALVQSWGLEYSLAGLERFAMTCVDAFGGQVAMVKPQSAFFEVFGAGGVRVLERVLAGLREAGTLTLLDVKRGDIGSTMQAYADAYLGGASPLRADAVTVSPYLGYGSLRPALDLAEQLGRGVFVLALTSNPEGREVQHAHREGQQGRRSVAGSVVDGVTADNAAARVRSVLGSVGLVIGATVGDAVQRLGLDLVAANAPILSPGVGAQGGTAEDLRQAFGPAVGNVLASSSRELLSAGPDPARLRAAATDTAYRLRESLA